MSVTSKEAQRREMSGREGYMRMNELKCERGMTIDVDGTYVVVSYEYIYSS